MLELWGYHGTYAQGLTSLIPSPRGTLGQGIYFTDKPESAANYGENVYSAKITLHSPWVISIEHESSMSEELDFDSPSIEAMLTLEGGREKVLRSRETDGMYGEDLQQQLQLIGHDGIVATYPDGCMEIVAFDPSQVTDFSVHFECAADRVPEW